MVMRAFRAGVWLAVFGLAGCTVNASLTREIADSCAEIAPLAAPPIIDGRVEEGLHLLPLVPAGWNASGVPPAGFSVRHAVAWRPDGLYFFVEVVDATRDPSQTEGALFCGDAVELYVDADAVLTAPPAYDDPGTTQFIVAAPATPVPTRRADRYRTFARLGSWASPAYGAFPRDDGYTVEAFVTAADLDLPSWSLGPGVHPSFDVAIDVGGPPRQTSDFECAGRTGQFALHINGAAAPGTCALPYCDPRAFCAPELLGR